METSTSLEDFQRNTKQSSIPIEVMTLHISNQLLLIAHTYKYPTHILYHFKDNLRINRQFLQECSCSTCFHIYLRQMFITYTQPLFHTMIMYNSYYRVKPVEHRCIHSDNPVDERLYKVIFNTRSSNGLLLLMNKYNISKQYLHKKLTTFFWDRFIPKHDPQRVIHYFNQVCCVDKWQRETSIIEECGEHGLQYLINFNESHRQFIRISVRNKCYWKMVVKPSCYCEYCKKIKN